ncbi:MAG: selenocysteine-specific translation elongation factor [Marinilabiliales bacterium]
MKHIIVGTAGHVDHGKTSLIKALTDFDCDTHPEEKKRGITINLGFTYFKLPSGNKVGIVDVPGHKDFIHNMVSGASGIDVVLLIIAADEGIMPQTIEHIEIIQSLNVKHGIVVITKSDLVDEETLELAKLEISDFLQNYPDFKNSPYVTVSSVNRQGLESLIEELEKIVNNIEGKHDFDFFRLYIDRIFSVKGIGTVVTGTVKNGSITTGNNVFILPDYKDKAKIKSIERHGEKVERVVAGDRAALNITGLEVDDFERGMLLSERKIKETQMIDASLKLHSISDKLNLWSDVMFYSSTIETKAKIHLLNKDVLNPGEEALVQIHTSKAVVLLYGDRFIIRNTSKDNTLGGGVILDTNPLHHKSRKEKTIKKIKILYEAVLNKDISKLAYIELDKTNRPQTDRQLCEKLNLHYDYFKNQTLNHPDINSYYYNDEIIFSTKDIDSKYRNKIVDEIRAYHEKNAFLPNGLEITNLYSKTGLNTSKYDKYYLENLLQLMIDEKILDKYQQSYILYNFKPEIDENIKDNVNWLEQVLLDYGLQKPVIQDIEALAVEKKISKDELKNYFTYLVNHNKVVNYQSDFLHKTIVDDCRKKILVHLFKNPVINISEFRQVLQATKKICPVLIGIFENEKIIKTKPIGTNLEIEITDNGKNLIKNI